MKENKKRKIKVRTMPENVFFIRNEKENGEYWFDISLNGGGYPSIEETEEMFSTMNEFLNYLKRISQDEIDKENKKIKEEWEREQIELNTKTQRKRKPVRGYIYLIKSNGVYKIGKAKSKERIGKYKTENPFEVEIVKVVEVDNYDSKERELLDKFGSKVVLGKEWLKLSDNDVEEVINLMNNHNLL